MSYVCRYINVRLRSCGLPGLGEKLTGRTPYTLPAEADAFEGVAAASHKTPLNQACTLFEAIVRSSCYIRLAG